MTVSLEGRRGLDLGAVPICLEAEALRVNRPEHSVVIGRVVAEAEAAVDRLAGLRRIGIDETSHRRGHKYVIVVVDTIEGSSYGPRPAAAKPLCLASLRPR